MPADAKSTPAAEAGSLKRNQDVITVSDPGDAPEDAVSIIPVKKEPPPETPEAIRLRAYVIASFWAIIILVGLPIWWWTTTIYRANLPLYRMMEWADGRVSTNCPVRNILVNMKSGMPTSFPSPNIH